MRIYPVMLYHCFFQILSVLRHDCSCDAALNASNSELITNLAMPMQKNPQITSAEVLEFILIG